MRITSKGQVTIPVEIREEAGLLPGTEVEFELHRGRAVIKRVEGSHRRGRRLVEAMKGKGAVRMSTDEIMALTRGEE